MSREVKRVALDFDHPLKDVWPGYCPPSLPNCPDCDGSGSTPAAQWVDAISGLLGQLGEDVPRQSVQGERGTMHPYLGRVMNRPTTRWNPEKPLDQHPDTLRPSADILDFLTGLTGMPAEEFTGFLANPGHRIAASLIKHAGLPEKWGWCVACDGSGLGGTPEQVKASKEWVETPPPAGDGWQLWETTSEGSPITPVFATAEELAQHIASPAYQYGAAGRAGISIEQATAMVSSGWAPTGASIGGRMFQAEQVPLAVNKADKDATND